VREKRVKTQTSEGKVMVCVFLDSGGILLLEFLEIGATVTPERDVKLLRELKQISRWIRP
jgi:hypothetical protein